MDFRLVAIGALGALAVFGVGVGAAAAADAPPPVEAYARLPHLDHVALSPSGKRVAFIVGTKTGRAVVVAENNKPLLRQEILEAPAQGARLKKEGKIRSVTWADEDHLIIAATKTEDLRAASTEDLTGEQPWNGLGEFEQVAVISLSAHKSFWVFDRVDEVLSTVYGTYGFAHRDGHAYGYFAGQPKSERGGLLIGRLDLFEIDLDTGQVRRQIEGTALDRNWLVGPDGTMVAYADYDRARQTWSLYDGKRQTELARDKNPYDTASIDGQGRTPGTIIYHMPDADGTTQFYETALDKDAKPVRLFDRETVDSLLFDRRSGLLIGRVVDGDVPDAVFFDAMREARWNATKKGFQGLNVSLVTADDAFDHLIVYVDGDGYAGGYWTVDLTTGKTAAFGQAYPDIPDASVGSSKVIAYKAQDGVEIHAILTLPAGRAAKALPVIVLPHGGPYDRDYLGFDWLTQAFASRGYAVLQPNFRGSSGYGHEFAQAGFGEWGRKMQTDVSDGLKFIADQGIVDPKRACIVGGSYGGYVALAGVTLQHGLYRCAVSVAGVSDLRAMLSDEDKHDPDSDSPEIRYWKDMMGARRVGDARLREVSPADQADHADAPILLIHGKDDTVVPIEQSLIMQRALKRAGKPVELVQLDSEDHHLSRQVTREAMLEAAVAFVEKYDPPN